MKVWVIEFRRLPERKWKPAPYRAAHASYAAAAGEVAYLNSQLSVGPIEYRTKRYTRESSK